MKGEPAFVVGLVDAGSVLHQEGHHVHVVIYACLKGGERERDGMSEQRTDLPCYAHAHELTSARFSVLSLQKEPCNAADRLPCGFGVVGNFGSRSDP